MNPKQWKTVNMGGLVISIALLAISLFLKDEAPAGPVGILGIAIFVIFMVLDMVFWRCPKCKKPLPKGRRADVKFCPECKAPIDGGEESGKKRKK